MLAGEKVGIPMETKTQCHFVHHKINIDLKLIMNLNKLKIALSNTILNQ